VFGTKTLANTLAKVTEFINELEDGITSNNTAVSSKQVKIKSIEQEVFDINAETAIAKKLLAKLQ